MEMEFLHRDKANSSHEDLSFSNEGELFYLLGGEAMKKNMKSIIISLIVIIIAIGGFFIYKNFNAKQKVEGDKTIEVTVISEKDKHEKTYTHKTNAETLGKALDEMKIIVADTSQATRFITGVDGLNADANKQEWWNLKINGENSQTGIDDTAIKDGDKIELILTIGW